MSETSNRRRYAAAFAAVVLVAAVTLAVPILRERFTFFLFWPLLLAVGWFLGTGPALLATGLATLAVLLALEPAGTLTVRSPQVLATLASFALIGATTALLAGWRCRAEAALRESRDRFAMVANAEPVLIWMTDAEGRAVYVNQPWLRFTGRAPGDALGVGWLDAVHPEDQAGHARRYAQAAATHEPFEREYRLRRADGTHRVVLERATPRLDADGRFAGYVGSCIDVTDQREALDRAEGARAAAEAANRAKDAFLATVSHELRAPLSPIITWAQMLRGDGLSPERRASALTVIERNARMQAQLVEDLLDVSRIVEGKLRLRVRPVRLGEVIVDAVDTVRPAADAKDIRLVLALDDGLPPIAGDPDRLQQVVWNLLSNAVKFTARGGRVEVAMRRVGHHVEVAVRDTGAGIASAQLPHLFERFWQADSSPTRAHAGLGLGLAIVRHLVELHGGEVRVESAGEGRGSTFTVELPIAPLAALGDGDGARRPPVLGLGEPVTAIRLDGVRVLLVDDEPDANEAVRMLLDQCGAEVRVAASTPLALEVLGRWKPDVLVSDVGMPGEDGYALLRQVHARPELTDLPAIALTAYGTGDDRARLLAAGFRRHLVKPAAVEELTAAVAAVAGARGR